MTVLRMIMSLVLLGVMREVCMYYVFDAKLGSNDFAIVSIDGQDDGKFVRSENKAIVSQFAVVLTDNLPNRYFSSSHYENLLVRTVEHELSRTKLNKHRKLTNAKEELYNRLSDFVAVPLLRNSKRYKRTVKKVISHSNISNKSRVYQHFSNKIKMAGAYIIDADTRSPKLRIFQIGNIKTMLMKINYTDLENDFRFYIPEFVTNDLSNAFDYPNHILSDKHNQIKLDMEKRCDKLKDSAIESDFMYYAYKKYLEKNLIEFSLPISHMDIIIIGNDGLFGNISEPMITIFFNYVMKMIEIYVEHDVDINFPEKLLDILVEEFYKFAKNGQDEFLSDFRPFSQEETQIHEKRITDEWFYCKILTQYRTLVTKKRKFPAGQFNVITMERGDVSAVTHKNSLNKNSSSVGTSMLKKVGSSIQKKIDISEESEIKPVAKLYSKKDKENKMANLLVKMEKLQNKIKPSLSAEVKKNLRNIKNMSEDKLNYSQGSVSIEEKIDNAVKGKKINDADQFIIGAASLALSTAKFLKEKLKFSKDLFTNSKCTLQDLMEPSLPSEISYMDSVVINPCVNDILYKLKFKKNYLKEVGFDIMTKALAGAVKKLLSYDDLKIFPHIARENSLDKKKDSVSVIVTSIKSKHKMMVEKDLEKWDNFEDILGELKRDMDVYLKQFEH